MNRRGFISKAFCLAAQTALSGRRHLSCGVEVIASSVEGCLIAEKAGASRIELAVNLGGGGMTPDLTLTRHVLHRINIPIRAMLRENSGFEIAGARELTIMAKRARALNSLPLDGIVCGYIKDGRPDVESMREILQAAPHLRFTFHNALELCHDPLAAIEVLTTLPQIDILLVHGKGVTLEERAASLQRYADIWQTAKRSLLVNGYTVEEAASLRRLCPFIQQFHFGSQVRTPPLPYPQGKIDAKKVAAICDLLRA